MTITRVWPDNLHFNELCLGGDARNDSVANRVVPAYIRRTSGDDPCTVHDGVVVGLT